MRVILVIYFYIVSKLFETNPDISQIYSKNFKYILVDEYQDTNYIQSRWLSFTNICK